MWAPDIYEGSPTPVTAFLSIAPKISLSANMSRVSIVGSYGGTLQQIFGFCSIASMILGALAAMAQTKVKRPLAHSSIGHVGYIRTAFSCGTIEGMNSLLIGIFIYVSMTIDAFAIVPALRQTRVKYIADLGALAKTNPISAMTFSITMFSYAGIPPLAGFCSKFYFFFAALGCGAYFLAPVGVLTESVATRMGMHATKDRVESDTSTVDSISLYESTITTRDEPGFGEWKLALGVIGLPVTARDRILSSSPLPSSFSTGVSAHMEAGQRWQRSNTGIRSKLAFLFDHFDRGGWIKWTKKGDGFQSKRWVLVSTKKEES
ncbi:hypothetical protein ZIOFF_074294 (mitochondrion) [Zingiber officinale]|uniref:NADH:quinone oxidoreductase/Mrp antiporter transmembrane domain-containing protein n=1 Tax=Zingiber officinale TaxID=94328 RepID=A0A8J5BAH1_ZINOF|nr:hypothetical protein ZIOFF_074294 [Zingiber officinale]